MKYPIESAQSTRVLAKLLNELILAEVGKAVTTATWGKAVTTATWDKTVQQCVAWFSGSRNVRRSVETQLFTELTCRLGRAY